MHDYFLIIVTNNTYKLDLNLMSITLESVKSNCLLEQVINTYVTYWYLQTNYHGKKSHRYFQETHMQSYNKIQLKIKL